MLRLFLFTGEFVALFRYYWQHEILDKPGYLFLVFIQYTTLALLLSFSYFQLGNSFLDSVYKSFVLAASRFSLTITSFSTLATYLIPDREFIRSGVNGLAVYPEAIFIAKYIIWTGYRNLLFIVFTAIVYPVVGLRGGFARYLLYLLILWIHQLTVGAIGFFISAAIPYPKVAVLVTGTVLILLLLFSGGILTGLNVPPVLGWISYIDPSYYTQLALLDNQFSGESIEGKLVEVDFYPRNYVSPMPAGVALLYVMLFGIGFFLLGLLAFRYTTRGLWFRKSSK